MERFTLDFSLPNVLTIGLIALLWYFVIVGGWSLAFNAGKPAASAS